MKKNSIKIKQERGEDYFVKLGRKGGKTPATKPKGFAARPDIASLAGRKSRKNGSKQPNNTI